VADVSVIGVPDPRYGEEIMAWIRPREGAVVDVEGVRAFCRERIAHFKCPRSVVFIAELPRLPTGKIARRLLPEELRR
ncbi:MAG: AMP-binding protein, partial [Acidimicrobiia bacterium]|nr:AMP-binding protein [Acidimicrobiia bacterium]